MHSKLTIVMYHYIRESKNSEYPAIKGLEFEGFKRQLDYLEDKYTIICAEDLLSVANNDKTELPEDACLLTFDDGYIDHFQYVFPELIKRKLQGSFFPPAKPILEGTLLEVNAIHHILAKADNVKLLIEDLKQQCRAVGVSNSDFDEHWTNMDKNSRYDSEEVIFFKRMLQRDLPEEIRVKITKNIFEKYLGKSEPDFSKELYLSIENIKEMIDGGMYFGSHTYNHIWLNFVDRKAQAKEIEHSIQFLKDIGAPTDNWIMCYPYGGFNEDTLSILRETGCRVGLTTNVGTVIVGKDNLLELKRYDTNDFPQY